MKKRKIVDENKIGVFGRIKRKISDWFYDLSVLHAEKLRKNDKVKKTSIKGRKFQRRVFYFAVAALPVLHYLVFYVGVNFNSVLLAFKEWKIVDGDLVAVWGGLTNFKAISDTFFYGTELKSMLANSLLYYGVGLFVGVPLALFFSYYIYKKYYFSEFFRIMLFLPSMISSVVTVFMYKYMIDHGLVQFAALFGKEIMPPLSEPQLRQTFVIFFNIMMSFGTNILMYASAMTRIPVSVVEYATLDGVKPFREFITITIPLIFDTLSTFLIVGISGIFTNQANIYTMFALTADSTIAPLGYHLFTLTNMGTTETNFPYAAALGLIFTAIAIPLTFGLRWVLDKINPDVQY